jgi:SAM-dependent methyltransferase
VLEVGPGTGQATRHLLDLGADRLVAVEPDPELARYLAATFEGRIELRVAPLEEVELEVEEFDLAAAATTFHWVDEPVGLDKIHRTLRPGGWIALWWTIFGDDDRPDPFRDAADPIVSGLQPSPHGIPSRPSFPLDVDARFAALRAARFAEPEHELIRWNFEWDAPGIRALFATFSPIASLDPERRDAILDEIARVAADDFGGRVVKPILTSLYTARKPD